MKRVFSAAIILTLSLALTHASAEIWAEQRITNTPWYETGPKIWQDKIYHGDYRTGSSDIYVWTAAEGSRPLIQWEGSQGVEAVYGDSFVFRSYTQPAQGYADLYLYDPANGIRAISTAPGDQKNADIFGDTVVFEDHQGPYSQVKIWDPVNGEKLVSPTTSWQSHPRIWNDTVVWEDGRSGWRSDVYRYSPTDGETLLSNYLNAAKSPAIYEDKIVMYWLDDPYSYLDAPGLYEWTPTGGLRRLSTNVGTELEVWDDLIVSYPRELGNILAYDPVHGWTQVNQTQVVNANMASLYGNEVAWVGGYDIFLSTMVPEPSGLVGLGGLGSLLCLRLRRVNRKRQRR
jgi:hypothetical protein